MIMNTQTLKAYVAKSVITGAIAAAAIFILASVFASPIVEPARFNDTYVVLHPSVAKAASLALSFWGIVGISFGALVFGASIQNYKFGVAPRLFGDNTDATVGIIGAIAGALIILFSYLGPAYRVQNGTTKTVTKTELQSIKKVDKEFTKAFQADSNLIKSIARPDELK